MDNADDFYADELSVEQANSGRYMEQMAQKSSDTSSIGRSRSADWTREGRPKLFSALPLPLAGRVALDMDDEDLGTDFYIGGWRYDADGLRVISWAAPLAAAFFENAPCELDEHVQVRRTLRAGPDDRISSFSDDWVTHPRPRPFEGQALTIPAPPPSEPRAAAPQPPPAPSPPAVSASARVETPPPPASPTKAVTPPRPEPTGLRAPKAVMEALAAPRRDRLASVLATLQPQQMDLVRRPAEPTLMVQGHPGTGKTIIAVHRAAYLVHEDSDQRVRSVLLVGPTEEYANHVTELLETLDPQRRVTVTSLQALAMKYAPIDKLPAGSLEGHNFMDVAWEAGSHAAHARRLMGSDPKLSDRKSAKAMRAVYEFMQSNGTSTARVTSHPEAIEWLASLPRWGDVITSPRFVPLLAQIGLELAKPVETFDHIIVDEAQDVFPIDYRMLDTLRGRGALSLFGDMNQRRSDHSYHSWGQLADGIGISDGLNKASPITIDRGFRSTGQIIKFANRLLTKSERGADCLQDGTPPTVSKTTPASLPSAVVSATSDALARHPQGTVAVISMDPRALIVGLRTAGFRAVPTLRHAWERDGSRIRVMAPDAARGLEFDAVVVVEPGDFPPNLGRHGLLYTSLTRANRELWVVHSKPLLDALRR